MWIIGSVAQGKGVPPARARVWPGGPTWQLRTHTQVLATGPKVSAPTLERVLRARRKNGRWAGSVGLGPFFFFFSLFFSLFLFKFRFSFLLLDFKFKFEFQLCICTYIKCANLHLGMKRLYLCIYLFPMFYVVFLFFFHS
jgi:hypothetical protein